jgi:RNA polymerase sigma-32 factor
MATVINASFDVSPEQNLTRYLQQIREFPMLAKDVEQHLARLWRDKHEANAMHQLVNSHLRLVAKIAMGYRGYGLPVGDLISEGNIGMIQAVKRFDPERGFRLSTYAMWWIKAAIQEYILHSWSLVKIGTTASQKKLFFNLRKLKSKLKALDEGDLHPEQVETIAQNLNVPETEVISMNRRMASHDQSLNVSLHEDGEGEWQDRLIEESDNQEQLVCDRQEDSSRQQLLGTALESLGERERSILVDRRLKDEPVTLQDLSRHYGISRERIRQIEVRAFEKVQKSVRNAVVDQNIAMH